MMILVAAAALPLLAADWRDDWKVEEKNTINKSFKVAAGDNVSKLTVDNLNGFIHVTGTPGTEVQVKVNETIRAETKDDAERAKKDVKLDMTQEGNAVKLYEDGPFRDHDGSTHYDSDRYHYRVIFDIEVQVPTGAQLDLKTLNNEVTVSKSTGNFTIHALNGKIDMDGIGGTGTVKTLNGPVKVAFTHNPTRESSFETLNGAIDIYFQPSLDADIAFRTMHGGVYSDFDVTTVPRTVTGNVGTRFVYRNNGDMKVRAGKGGATLSFRTLNGPIRLHSKA